MDESANVNKILLFSCLLFFFFLGGGGGGVWVWLKVFVNLFCLWAARLMDFALNSPTH